MVEWHLFYVSDAMQLTAKDNDVKKERIICGEQCSSEYHVSDHQPPVPVIIIASLSQVSLILLLQFLITKEMS